MRCEIVTECRFSGTVALRDDVLEIHNTLLWGNFRTFTWVVPEVTRRVRDGPRFFLARALLAVQLLDTIVGPSERGERGKSAALPDPRGAGRRSARGAGCGLGDESPVTSEWAVLGALSSSRAEYPGWVSNPHSTFVEGDFKRD